VTVLDGPDVAAMNVRQSGQLPEGKPSTVTKPTKLCCKPLSLAPVHVASRRRTVVASERATVRGWHWFHFSATVGE
jgi:hypothetical protein